MKYLFKPFDQGCKLLCSFFCRVIRVLDTGVLPDVCAATITSWPGFPTHFNAIMERTGVLNFDVV